MNTIQQLEIILDRMQRCPKNLIRVELEMFHNALKRDPHLNTVLDAISRHNRELDIEAKASDIVSRTRESSWADLGFANSAPLRAALGFQICDTLLKKELNPMRFGNMIEQLGTFYRLYQVEHERTTPSDAIRVFSEVFLHPLLSYLRGALETRDQILLLLSRYKQRREWFPDEITVNNAGSDIGKTEKWLKRDFLRYLFDNGIDFSTEAETPAGGGEADVLFTLPELGPFSLEAKVFDRNARDASHISGGLAQAADYARKFNQPTAYFITYNIVSDTLLVLPGTTAGSNVAQCRVQGVDVYSIAINTNRSIPSSRASRLEPIYIPLPPDNG
ncbi:MAG: hypothetical protein HW388_1452 [Dehalococcoidia bacterium]|nr:hypothetical protein [Dehalococcoidia bacterium]